MRYLDACLERRYEAEQPANLSQIHFDNLLRRFQTARLSAEGNLELAEELALIIQIFTNHALYEATRFEKNSNWRGSKDLLIETIQYLAALDGMEEEEEEGALFRLKVKLIKLAAYLLYRNPENQRIARECAVIPLIKKYLATYDANNPCKNIFLIIKLK